jgi:hypothetical protein
VLDAGHSRNERSRAVHGFLSRDGTPRKELPDCARQQLSWYPNVTLQSGKVVDAEQTAEGFTVILADGSRELTPERCWPPVL